MASAGAGEADRLAVESHLAGVRLVDAGDDLHQRGLARPVLADDGEHLAGRERERHAVEGEDAGELLVGRR